jgi:hypothetical protein
MPPALGTPPGFRPPARGRETAPETRQLSKKVQESLYTTASVIAAPRKTAKTGKFTELSSMTGLKTFVTSLAGHVAAQAARLG